MMFFLLLLAGAFNPEAPSQTIAGAESPVEYGEVVVLTVDQPAGGLEGYQGSSYEWKIVDLAGKEVKLRPYADGNKKGVFFGAGIKSRRLKAFCFASHIFVRKEGSSIKEVAVRSAILTADVVIGEVQPDPPGPGPGPGPMPPVPAGGMGVLIVYESAELSKMPNAQQAILFGARVRSYLSSKCELEEGSKTRAYRIWDKDVDPSGDLKVWQDALARPRTQTPWVVITKGGKPAFEGPLPGDVEAFLSLLGKYEVK